MEFKYDSYLLTQFHILFSQMLRQKYFFLELYHPKSVNLHKHIVPELWPAFVKRKLEALIFTENIESKYKANEVSPEITTHAKYKRF